MLDYERLIAMGTKCGFSHVGKLDVSTIQLMPEVRKMCEANTCRMYGKNWCCPPGVGSLDECGERISRYKEGILVQTVGELEDALDGEAMMETEAAHREHFEALRDELLKRMNVKEVFMTETGGLSTVYANDGGIIVAI